jgi:hypothetical protein
MRQHGKTNLNIASMCRVCDIELLFIFVGDLNPSGTTIRRSNIQPGYGMQDFILSIFMSKYK